jgi:hypothetical protein
MHRRTSIRTALLALALAALAVAPGAALADDLPDAIDDPAVAVAPQPDPGPVEPAAPTPAPEVDDTAPEVEIQADAADAVPASRVVRAPVAATQVSTTGSLPFTGSDSRQLAMLLLVGLVAGCGGAVALAWARVADNHV